MSGWSSNASTATLSPLTTLNTPSGRPASAHSSATSCDADGSRSLGLRTNVLPQAMATGCIHIGTITGKLNGVMPATTPSGWRNEYTSTLVDTWSENEPLSSCGIPQANSTTSRPRCTSPRASETTLPCSSETISARSLTRALTSSRNANMIFVRFDSDACDHSSKAAFAVCTASSTSAAEANATCACCAPVAGLNTGPNRSPDPAVCLPPIQWFIVRTCLSPSSQVRPLVGLVRIVRGAGLAGGVEPGHLGHRYVPPRPAAWRGYQRIGFDVHHDRPALVPARVVERGPQVVDALGAQHPHAQALRVGGEVDGQQAAVQAPAAGVAVPVPRAEPLHAELLGQRPDRGEPVVLHQDDDDLHALLDGGHQFLGHHQVRAVADHDVHVAVGAGQPRAQAAGDLVAHAGVPVLDVVALRIPGPPQLVQVARHRTGGAHDHVARPGAVVDRADHLGLGRQRFVAQVVGALHDAVPLGGEPACAVAVRGVDRPAGKVATQGKQRFPGVRDQAHAGLLGGVERGHVDVDETHAGVLERGSGRGGEVAV